MSGQSPQPTPCGSWRSPISARMLAEHTVGLSTVCRDGDDIYWVETRFADAGRSVVVHRRSDGRTADVTAAPHNARTRVQEYGGGAFAVHGGVVWYSNMGDGRLYRVSADAREPQAVTPEGAFRYADLFVDALHDRILCVREDHANLARSSTPGQGDRPPEAQNTVVAVPMGDGEPQVLAQGADFYAAPRVDGSGTRICWLSWNHPNMPWDGCELWVGSVDGRGRVSDMRLVVGGENESICQPAWSPDGVLHFVSDRSGWWNIYCVRDGRIVALTAERGEFGDPAWTLGQSRYAFESESRIVCSWFADGRSHLGRLDTVQGALVEVPSRLSFLQPWITAIPGHAITVGGSPGEPTSVVDIALDNGDVTVLRASADVRIDPAYISAPQPLEFPTSNGRSAHAQFYPPASADHTVPDGELPPLLVRSHGGPTSQATTGLDLEIQFWTTRGFAYVDVDYGGSSGYGREYRGRLDGTWGVVDIDDCVSGALHLARVGRADPSRLIIHGGSAGGYTTLAALTFRDVFAAGASYFGVADLELLAVDTHKFESRYLDRLVGPYPERRDLYTERSPIHFTDRLSRPVILFQGLDDRIVPPSQAEAMFAAVRERGIPCAYLAFEGEDHGFRKAENIVRAQEAELTFYGRVLDFIPADGFVPLDIANLPG